MAEQQRASRPLALAKEVEGQLIARAWKDPSFAEELRAHPKAVLQRELSAIEGGVQLPDNVEVRLVEESPNVITLVLPDLPRDVRDFADRELYELSAVLARTKPNTCGYRVCDSASSTV